MKETNEGMVIIIAGEREKSQNGVNMKTGTLTWVYHLGHWEYGGAGEVGMDNKFQHLRSTWEVEKRRDGSNSTLI